MKINYKTRKTISQILSVVLLCALGIGAISGVSALSEKLKDERKQIYPTFAVGSVDENGTYKENERSIYTPELVECQGLSIEPDFEATGTFRVFYYNMDKVFLGSTDEMNASDGVYTKDSIENTNTFPLAAYCRIVITPSVPVDDDGVEVENFEIHFWEVAKYASEYTISVNKEQKNLTKKNLFVRNEKKEGYICAYDNATGEFIEKSSASGNGYCLIDVSHLTSLSVEYEKAADGLSYFFYDEDNNHVHADGGIFTSGTKSFVIEVPEGAVTFGVIYNPTNLPAVYVLS